MRKLCMCVLVLTALRVTAEAKGETVRLRYLAQHVGSEVTVKVRTGIIAEAQETPGVHAFTVRDDYGDDAVVLTKSEYPVFGATYLITGTPRRDSAATRIVLQESSRQRAFSTAPTWLLPAVAVVVLLGVIAVAVIIRRRGAGLPPAWGFAEVVAGPDQGKSFSLRGDRIIVGRGQDPTVSISLVMDESVSREHGAIVRQGGNVFYEDTSSRNGSQVDNAPAPAGQRVAINPGAVIQVGTQTRLRRGSPGNAMETQGPGGETGTWGEPGPHETVGA